MCFAYPESTCQDKGGPFKATVLSNSAFLLPPLFALGQCNPVVAAITVIPAVASTIYHMRQDYSPSVDNLSNDTSLIHKIDTFGAIGVCGFSLIFFLKYCNRNYILSIFIILIIVFALWLFYNDSNADLYCIYHSFWHILCGVSLLLILSLQVFDSQNKI